MYYGNLLIYNRVFREAQKDIENTKKNKESSIFLDIFG